MKRKLGNMLSIEDARSWSSVVDNIQDDANELKKLTLDLTDTLFEEATELQRLEKLVSEQKSKMNTINIGLSNCLHWGSQNFGFPEYALMLHDTEKKMISIKKEGDKIIVEERFITL